MKQEQADPTGYSDDDRVEMIRQMKAASATFYMLAIHTGVHAFIEFTGLINEFITVCEEAHAQGIPFEFSNTHTNEALPYKPHHLTYLAEKLNCIYGPGLLKNDTNRDAFIRELLGGKYVLEETAGYRKKLDAWKPTT